MDMNVACSSATFALQVANNFIQSGGARCILVVSPELTTGHVNFLDRDSHFIFSDACAAVVLESEATCQATSAFTIVSGELKTSFSNNIRNDFGFLNHCEVAPPGESGEESVLFRQNGRKVFKEVVPMTVNTILSHLDKAGVSRQQLKRLWLHQANSNMDRLIGQKVFDRDPSPQELPIILDEYANTAAAGSIIAFHHHRDDLQSEDYGVICSFGAGYSIGSLIVQKV